MPMRLALLAVAVVAIFLALPGAGARAAVNDPSCRPTAQRPYPVVLVHGTFANVAYSWNAIAPQLERDGFCVFALDYGGNARAPYDESADQIAAFTREVLRTTGAAKVAFVGHSQGGSISRYVARYRDLLARTDEVVGLAPSSHGTEQPLTPVAAAGLQCAACTDQMAGSPIMQKLNAPPEAPEEVDWTVVATRYDTVVVPYQSQALTGRTVTNVVVQDACPTDLFEHVAFPYDPVAIQWMRNALLRDGPANPAFVPDCTGLTLGRDPSPTPSVAADAAAPGDGANGGPAGTSGPPARPTSPSGGAAARPRLELRGSRVRLRGGRMLVPVRCRSARCVGTVVVRRGRRTLASGTVVLAAGRSATARLRLRPGAQRYLRANRGARLTGHGSALGGGAKAVRRYRLQR